MNWVEALGIVAGGLVYSAMLFKRLVPIRAFLLSGAIGFLCYGILRSLPAVIIVNGFGVCFGTYALVDAIRKTRSERQKTGH